MSKSDPARKPDSVTSPELPAADQTEHLATLDLPSEAPTEAIAETLVPPDHGRPTDQPAPTEALSVDPHRTNFESGSGTELLSASAVRPSLTEALTASGSQSHFAPVTAATLVSQPPSQSATDGLTLEPSAAGNSQPHGSQRPTTPAFHGHDIERDLLPAIEGYEVLSELGRGGMGVVYKARHRKLNRLVALKMVLHGHRSSSVKRFHAEAEAVARFQHPNIVQVYEIGQHGEQPFFSLEYIEGGTLSHRVERTPQPPREAARLVQHLAEAMDYAHRRGILHRDLKPANILLAGVESKPGDTPPPLSSYVPKITDFGLAKELEADTGQTRDGAVMGTPSYMAPEQAQGKIKQLGPPADVYSLGAILYEMLTGVPPFLGTTVVETLSQVVESEPLPPRRMQPKCPRDLQTICLKCLEKEARKRYASAGELAEDLRRYCDNEPIRARPAPAWERAWKWAKRRPAAATLAVVSVLALLGFAAGGVLIAREAEQRREVAEDLAHTEEKRRQDAEEHALKEKALRETAEREHARAEANFKQARSAVQEIVLLGHSGLALEPHLEKIRRNLLRKGLAFHREFLHINHADASRRRDCARAQLRLAEIEVMLGDREAAEKTFRGSIGGYQELLAQSPEDRESRLDLATAWSGLAVLLQDLRRPEEAAKAFHESIVGREKLRSEQDEARARLDLASGYNDRGAYHAANGRNKEAESDFLRALPLVQQLHDGDQANEDYRRQLALTHCNLGGIWTVMKNAQAEDAFGKSLPLWQTLKDETPESPHYQYQLAAAILNRGALRHLASRPREAENDYHQAGELLAELADQYRGVADYRRLLVNADGNHGELLKSQDRPREAEKVWRRYVTVLATLAKEFPKEVALRQRLGRGHNDLAIALFQLRRYPEAETAWRSAVEVQRALIAEQKTEPADWKDLLASLSNLASGLTAVSPSDAAEKAWREAVTAQEQRVQAFKNQPEHLAELAEASNALAQLLLERKEPAKARAALESAVRAQRTAAAGRPNDAALKQALTQYNIALVELLLNQGDHAAAGSAIGQAEQAIAPEKAAAFLVRCMTLAEKTPQAQTHSDRAMEALRKAVQGGYKNRKALETGADFAPLRQRPDFQQLLRQIGK